MSDSRQRQFRHRTVDPCGQLFIKTGISILIKPVDPGLPSVLASISFFRDLIFADRDDLTPAVAVIVAQIHFVHIPEYPVCPDIPAVHAAKSAQYFRIPDEKEVDVGLL